METVQWKIKAFTELSVTELYEILKIRQEVFVVEQTCDYLDVDGYDDKAIHLWAESNGEILAYCRLFDSGIKYTEASIGRVLTNRSYRTLQLGKTLMKFALLTIEARFGASSVRISAQDYLLRFYSEFGFQDTGIKYLEDDIPHTEMLKSYQSF